MRWKVCSGFQALSSCSFSKNYHQCTSAGHTTRCSGFPTLSCNNTLCFPSGQRSPSSAERSTPQTGLPNSQKADCFNSQVSKKPRDLENRSLKINLQPDLRYMTVLRCPIKDVLPLNEKWSLWEESTAFIRAAEINSTYSSKSHAQACDFLSSVSM